MLLDSFFLALSKTVGQLRLLLVSLLDGPQETIVDSTLLELELIEGLSPVVSTSVSTSGGRCLNFLNLAIFYIGILDMLRVRQHVDPLGRVRVRSPAS